MLIWHNILFPEGAKKKLEPRQTFPPAIGVDVRDVARAHILAAQNTVMWGGAPLRESAGDYLVQNGVRLIAWGGW